MCTCYSAYIKVRGQLMGVDSLLPYEPWGLNLVLRLDSKYLFAEPYRGPTEFVFLCGIQQVPLSSQSWFFCLTI